MSPLRGARRADLLAEFARRDVRIVADATITRSADGAAQVVRDGTAPAGTARR